MEYGVPTGFGAEIELQFHFLGAALALARSDRKAVRDAAKAMAERAATTGYTVYAPVAAALAAAADDPPPLTALPQMLLLVRSPAARPPVSGRGRRQGQPDAPGS